ncbi:hypothetical protein HNR23_005063 [Nocardiopsis mwathae]|uniref:DUF3180 domain-containing protein n=1 Tax=Nocardiopsis mwathae TaxID=1472723 RepID=A0A7W9YMP2_9ACTN|nr:DUF3180 domain-containing protein [Nocardiopsis mwathae]MBB6175003.1 hypothetical protein [Nocardiopsis mwathae]
MDDERNGKPREGGMRLTGWQLPLGIILVSGALAYVVVEAVYGRLPILPWTAIPTLLLLAAGEGIAAWHTRRRIRRVPGTEPVDPLSAARLVALAKASVIIAALVIGVFGGTALSLADRLDVPTPRADALTAFGTMLAGIVLLAVSLWLEHACRVPEDGDDSSGPVTPTA